MPAEREPRETGDIGERHVVNWLRNKGFRNITHDTSLPGSTDIEADDILIQVKTSTFPNKPAYPSPDEIRNLKSRAGNLGKEAYIAQVTIFQDGLLAKDIEWLKP